MVAGKKLFVSKIIVLLCLIGVLIVLLYSSVSDDIFGKPAAPVKSKVADIPLLTENDLIGTKWHIFINDDSHKTEAILTFHNENNCYLRHPFMRGVGGKDYVSGEWQINVNKVYLSFIITSDKELNITLTIRGTQLFDEQDNLVKPHPVPPKLEADNLFGTAWKVPITIDGQQFILVVVFEEENKCYCYHPMLVDDGNIPGTWEIEHDKVRLSFCFESSQGQDITTLTIIGDNLFDKRYNLLQRYYKM